MISPAIKTEIEGFQKDIKTLRDNAEKKTPLMRKVWRARAYVVEKIFHALMSKEEKKLLL